MASSHLSPDSTKKGFTIIEVSIFLAITGLMLIGVLGGTYRAIATQRYQDSVRSFSEFLRQVYGEVISPETLGLGNSNDQSIYGKIVVFGLAPGGANSDQTVYTATLIGKATLPPDISGSFMDELKSVEARLYCGESDSGGNIIHESSVSTYTPLWGAQINTPPGTTQLKGTLIIARMPSTGAVHAAFKTGPGSTFSIDSGCQPSSESASNAFKAAIADDPASFSTSTDIDFCLRSENSNIIRDIRLTAGVRNTSAVNVINADDGDNKCR